MGGGFVGWFPLAPRESAAFDDMVRGTFGAPDTAGGVEFLFEGPADQLVVTSRLYSTSPTPTVGMVGLMDDVGSHVRTPFRRAGDVLEASGIGGGPGPAASECASTCSRCAHS